MSNKFNQDRQRLARPPVCESPDPPVGNCTCSINPGEEVIQFQTVPIAILACCSDVPDPIEIDLVISAERGFVDAVGPFENCVETETSEYTAPFETGPDTITATFTWPDGRICVSVFVLEVIPEV